MKKIAALIAMTLVATSAQAIVVNTQLAGTMDSHTLKESFSGSTTPGISTAGTWAMNTTIDGQLFMSGTLNLNYTITGNANSYAYATTYTNATYNLGSASASSVDTSNASNWVIKYSWGYAIGNSVSWGTFKAPTPPSVTKDTNGSYLGTVKNNNSTGGNGTTALTGGSSSCVGNGCTLWGPNSFGIEGMTLVMQLDSTNTFSVNSAQIILEDVIGSGGTFQIETFGSGDDVVVPVPAAAWLMGSGLVGLAGIARRRKMA